MSTNPFDLIARESGAGAFVAAAAGYVAGLRRVLIRRDELSLEQLQEIACTLEILGKRLREFEKRLHAEADARGHALPNAVRRGSFGQPL
jgi:hypothetical protein